MFASKTDIARDSRRVKKVLVDAGWRVGTLARHFGVSHSTISNLLAGREHSKWLQCEIASLCKQDTEAFWGTLYWRHIQDAKRRPNSHTKTKHGGLR